MTSLNVLFIDDSEDDVSQVARTLADAGYDLMVRRVETADSLRAALETLEWHVIIADYGLVASSVTRTMAAVREHGADLPLIFVSGTAGEELAVAAMKAGAHDYLMKGNLARLGAAVERELREAAVRRERRRAAERVTHLAYHDALTDLPNRSLLHDRLQQAMLTAKREDKSLALLALDLDGFKEINDSFGHHAGDRVLQQLAARLRGTLRESDTIARVGGDEFAILLPLTNLEGAVLTAEKVLEDLELPVMVESRPLCVRGSIGLAVFPDHGATMQDLLQKADVAMYLAKSDHSGYAIYTADRDRHTEQRLALTAALRRGLNTKQFVLEYQPIIQLRSGQMIGVEALLRWNHPEQGRLLPRDFIQVAERSGLITPLTTFAIERALAEWPADALARPGSIAVNLSPRSLQDASFPGRVRRTLAEYRMDPSSLALEITENLIMADPEGSTRCLRELHDMGIRLIVDDFGTGYSSLSYLRRLPVDQLKIDQSFVIGLAAGEDETLVKSIIDLAHNLRLGVIAEGVETAEVQARLLALGCDAAQGHYISWPGTAAEISRFITEHNQPLSRA
jgi:diguanylate cyclase